MAITERLVFDSINTTSYALDGINTEVSSASDSFAANTFSSQYARRVVIQGYFAGIGTKSSANGNLTIKIKYGTNTIATITLSPTTSLSGKSMEVCAEILWVSDTAKGTSGTALVQAGCYSDVATLQQTLCTATAATVDGSVASTWGISGTFATADAANVGSIVSLSVQMYR